MSERNPVKLAKTNIPALKPYQTATVTCTIKADSLPTDQAVDLRAATENIRSVGDYSDPSPYRREE